MSILGDALKRSVIKAAIVWSYTPPTDVRARDALLRAITDYEMVFPDAAHDAMAEAEQRQGDGGRK
jgi:hypothetical protein